jgi:hypothetical protein
MGIMENHAAIEILKEAAIKLGALGLHWDFSNVSAPKASGQASVALHVAESQMGVATGRAVVICGAAYADVESKSFESVLGDQLAEQVVDAARFDLPNVRRHPSSA